MRVVKVEDIKRPKWKDKYKRLISCKNFKGHCILMDVVSFFYFFFFKNITWIWGFFNNPRVEVIRTGWKDSTTEMLTLISFRCTLFSHGSEKGRPEPLSNLDNLIIKIWKNHIISHQAKPSSCFADIKPSMDDGYILNEPRFSPSGCSIIGV
jgi:hypothetical protein